MFEFLEDWSWYSIVFLAQVIIVLIELIWEKLETKNGNNGKGGGGFFSKLTGMFSKAKGLFKGSGNTSNQRTPNSSSTGGIPNRAGTGDPLNRAGTSNPLNRAGTRKPPGLR